MRKYQITITLVEPKRRDMRTLRAYADAEESVYEALAAANFEFLSKLQEEGVKLPKRGYRESNVGDYNSYMKRVEWEDE